MTQLILASGRKLKHDITGQSFGRLVVIGIDHEKTNRGLATWVCKCSCGNEVSVIGTNLKRGMTVSCGCFHREKLKARVTKHGVTVGKKPPKEYKIWISMKSRCYDQNCAGYRNYGARGIVVCERWRKSYLAFIQDVGPRPSERHSIDRINNDGNYEPGNVRWATPLEQARNKRQCRAKQ